MEKFLEELGFYKDNDQQWVLEDKHYAGEYLSESMGSIAIEDLFFGHFNPIMRKVELKAKELKQKIEVETSVEYGLVIVYLEKE